MTRWRAKRRYEANRRFGERADEALVAISILKAKRDGIDLEQSEEDEGAQTFVLYDLASANGTFAGDRETYRDNQIYRYELEDGDFVLVGETTLVFKQVELDEAP